MARLKRSATTQANGAPKRQRRFIEAFLAGGLANQAPDADSEDGQEQVLPETESRTSANNDSEAGMLVDTPQTNLTPENPSTPADKKVTLPLRKATPQLSTRSTRATRTNGNTVAVDLDDEEEGEEAPSTTKKSASTRKKRQPKVTRPSQSLFQLWGQSSPSEEKERENEPEQKVPLEEGRHVYSKYPPEILRGLYTSPPGTRSKPGLNRNLPPLSKIDDIFDDLAKKAMKHGFGKVLDHLGSRELRVATMFSGTESPLLALNMLQNSLRRLFGRTFRLQHLFSAEIEPFKQSYIQRNFSPELIFRDVTELVTEEATTAFGSVRRVPTDIDLLVMGFPCVDFSNLNKYKKGLEDEGESGHTFNGVLRYCRRCRPPLIVVENVCSAPWEGICSCFEDLGYAAYHTKVDTKNYYIPQTRERGYMICVDTNRFDADDVTDPKNSAFGRLMKTFERPASSPITHFMLKEADPRFRLAVDDISAMPIKDRQAVDWTRYKARHLAYRIQEKLGDKRPLTKWSDNGACYPPDFYWRKWMQVQTERVWDTLDANYLRAFIRGYDMNFKSRFIDLSQGIDRELDTRAYGIAGCLTPRGQAFITSRGGPLLGIESLALQGIPVDKLLISSESQRDLQDLAGNAMSSTVVASAMSCILILCHKALDPGEEYEVESKEEQQVKRQLSFMDEKSMVTLPAEEARGEAISTKMLYEAAKKTARICFCEGQSTSRKWNLLRCTKCGHTACTDCGVNPTHQYAPIPQQQLTEKWMDFENHLKRTLPMRFTIDGLKRDMWESLRDEGLPPHAAKAWDKYLAVLDSALGDELRFHSITRQSSWYVTYEGTHTRLELSCTLARVQWSLYINSPRDEPSNSPLRSMLSNPVACMVPSDDNVLQGIWYIVSPVSSRFDLTVEGKGEVMPSIFMESGLQHKKYANMQVYSLINISGSDEQVHGLGFDIRGDYELLQNCGAASGSLHKKVTSSSGELPIYFFLNPTEIGEVDFDSWVFSLDHERLDTLQSRITIAELSPTFKGITTQNNVQQVTSWFRKREAHSEVGFNLSASEPTYKHPEVDVAIRGATCEDSYVPFWTCNVPATRAEMDLKKASWLAANLAESPDLLQRFSWLLQRAASLVQFEDWTQVELAPGEDSPQCCSLCSPKKPRLMWTLGDKDQVQPYENPEDAAEYEQNIKKRPAPFVGFFNVDKGDDLHVRVCLNVVTLLHQARGRLCEGNGTSLQWRLCIDNVGFLHPRLSQLKEKANDDDEESAQPPGFRQFRLRKEQLRSLTWMKAQEREDIEPFVEEEVVEALVPSINWRAEAKATTEKTVRGGILGDEVGYGKTAISLALFDSQYTHDIRSVPDFTNGAIPVKATAIVVPNHLVDQWRNEISKFLGNKYKVIEIKTINALNALSIREIQTADIVLVSATVFKGDKYFEKVSLFASPPGEPRGDGRIFDEWLREAMEGVRTHVNCLVNEGAEALAQRIHDKTEELKDSDIYRKYQPSKRLKGARLQEHLAKIRAEKAARGEDPAAAEEVKPVKREGPAKGRKESKGPTQRKLRQKSDSNAEKETSEGTAEQPVEETEEQRDSISNLSNGLSNGVAAKKASLKAKFEAVVVDNSGWSKEKMEAYVSHDADVIMDKDEEEEEEEEEDDDESEEEIIRPSRGRAARNARPRRSTYKEEDSDEYQMSGASDEDDDDGFADDWSDDSDFAPKKKAAPKASFASKRKREESSDGDVKPEPKKKPAKKAAPKKQYKGVPTGEQRQREAQKTFSLHIARNNWAHMKSPLLHMFEFNRVVIDEFTYSKDRNYTAVLALPARKKWILSGTPPLRDFADVKSFSPFLDVALGMDDDDEGSKPENERLRIQQRDRTDAEQFRPFVTRHSAAWHTRRHQVAQGFLDRFMRKNIPLFEEIPWTEHVMAVAMSPAERANYLEIYMQLMAANLRLKRANDKDDTSDESKQLDAIVKESASPEEVLLKRCCLSTTLDHDEVQDDMSGAAAVKAREHDLTTQMSELAKKLKQGWWLQSRLPRGSGQNHFDTLVTTLNDQGWGDKEITERLCTAIEKARKEHKPSDGSLFYSTKEERDENRHGGRPKMPGDSKAVMSALKICTDHLHRIIAKIIARTRSIRLLKAVQAFHRAHAGDVNSKEHIACDLCGDSNGTILDYFILGECGHIVCGKCLEASQEAEQCQAPVCSGSVQSFRILSAGDIGIREGAAQHLPAATASRSSKFAALLNLLQDKNTIPADDRVILFIQFPEVIKAASDALHAAGISHLTVSSNDHHASAKVNQFQSGKERARVLILNLGDVTAAGLNLQVANHIIFLAPLFAGSQYEYTSGMAQAVGRARRYGQNKHVHIYHLMMLNTIEVNIFEQRRHERVVRRDGKFLALEDEEVNREEAIWHGKDLEGVVDMGTSDE